MAEGPYRPGESGWNADTEETGDVDPGGGSSVGAAGGTALGPRGLPAGDDPPEAGVGCGRAGDVLRAGLPGRGDRVPFGPGGRARVLLRPPGRRRRRGVSAPAPA